MPLESLTVQNTDQIHVQCRHLRLERLSILELYCLKAPNFRYAGIWYLCMSLEKKKVLGMRSTLVEDWFTHNDINGLILGYCQVE